MVKFLQNSHDSKLKINPQNKAGTSQEQKLSDSSDSCGLVLDRERLQTILENVPSAVVVMEKPDGKITYVNKRALELHGINPCGFEIDVHPSKLKILTMNGKIFPVEELYTYKAMVYGKTTRNEPAIIERPDGKRFIVNVSVQPLYDKEGNITAAIAIFDDVTEYMKTQEALKESETRLNMAQRIAKLGSWEYHVEEDKAIWSEELFRIFNLKPQPYGPNLNSYINLIHPEDREKVWREVHQLNRKLGETASYDYRIILSDGSLRTIHSESMIREVDRRGIPKKVVGIEQDITERKQIEEKLGRYSANLERLVEERTNQLKNAERLATIGQVAGMVGHDIRNPLQAIMGDVYILKVELENLLNGENKQSTLETISAINENIQYINKIIADLQDYARKTEPKIEEIDLENTIQKTLTAIRVPQNIQKNFAIEPNIRLKTDPTYIRRIITNLATNAIQAMPKGGKLTIEATYKDDSKTAQISIIDTGEGIPKEIQNKLFKPLFTTKAKGQGFGLAVVKKFVEELGGTITFESQQGKGTKFIITLPA